MIGFEQDGRVGHLYLQRSSHANKFTSEMLGRIAEVVFSAQGEADIIVIHAVGDDFSLGRDREEPKNPEGPYASFSEISRVNAAFSRNYSDCCKGAYLWIRFGYCDAF